MLAAAATIPQMQAAAVNQTVMSPTHTAGGMLQPMLCGCGLSTSPDLEQAVCMMRGLEAAVWHKTQHHWRRHATTSGQLSADVWLGATRM
jgi:hypothetical protein